MLTKCRVCGKGSLRYSRRIPGKGVRECEPKAATMVSCGSCGIHYLKREGQGWSIPGTKNCRKCGARREEARGYEIGYTVSYSCDSHEEYDRHGKLEERTRSNPCYEKEIARLKDKLKDRTAALNKSERFRKTRPHLFCKEK